MLDLDAIETRISAATPGPWQWYPEGLGKYDEPKCLWGEGECNSVILLEDRYDGWPECGEDLRMDITEEDRAFIANIRMDAPKMSREIRRLLFANWLLSGAAEHARVALSYAYCAKERNTREYLYGTNDGGGAGFYEQIQDADKALANALNFLS